MTSQDPYSLLRVTPESDDETIRQRYLELVRQHPPESNPREFAAIRAAYESIRTADQRLTTRLFEVGKNEDLEAIIEEMECRMPRKRFSLAKLIKASKT